MNSIFKVITLTMMLLAFSGCKQKSLTYLDLMRHPALIQDELANCQTHVPANCDLVKRAERDYSLMNSERVENPEQFGQKILQAQQELGKMQVAKADTTTQLEHVNAMLAIVSATSPD